MDVELPATTDVPFWASFVCGCDINRSVAYDQARRGLFTVISIGRLKRVPVRVELLKLAGGDPEAFRGLAQDFLSKWNRRAQRAEAQPDTADATAARAVDATCEAPEELPFNPAFLRKIDAIALSVRARNCLNALGVTYLGDLVQMRERELKYAPNLGKRSLAEIKEALADLGLHFGMTAVGWPPKNVEELAKQQVEESAAPVAA